MGKKVTNAGPAVFQKQPGWFRFLNKFWKISYPVGRIDLSFDTLIKAARKQTDLSEFGSSYWEEPFRLLLGSVEDEAHLHPVGRFIAKQRFVSLLSMRLRAEYFFKKYPDILRQDVYPAWVIIGLQRTGTTKLQRLLATDPDHRVVYSWEAINPVPLSRDYFPGTNFEKDVRKRVSVARTSARGVEIMSPAFNAIHPISIFEPEEDILLLDVSFMSTTPEAMMNVPSYAGRLEQTDQSEAYAYAVKLLKLLQWQNPARRWILKSPHHLEFTEIISKYFDVRFLWPHRTIYQSIPSFLSMVTYTNMMFSDKVDPQRIADHWVRKTGYMLDCALAFRERRPDLFIDLHYEKLVKNAVDEVSNVYQLNGGMTDELVKTFRKHEAENRHNKHGRHQYSLADFKLTKEDIDRYTTSYRTFINNHDTGGEKKL